MKSAATSRDNAVSTIKEATMLKLMLHKAESALGLVIFSGGFYLALTAPGNWAKAVGGVVAVSGALITLIDLRGKL